jgi:membrane protein implicated in regulation of membrane protease activity
MISNMELDVGISIAFIVLGVLMLLAEISSPGVFLIVPGTVLIILGFIGLAFPEFLMSIYSPLLAVAILVPMTLITIKLYQRLAPPAPPETTVATSLVGREGIVTHEVTPDSLSGKVRIEHDYWSATADRTIPVGKKVVVKASEGVHVVVEEM